MMMAKIAHVQRPRVEGEREDEILDATVELLLEVGYDRLTMDAVAREARASKATLYRRWESKASLVVEALARGKSAPHVDEHDTGTLRGDLLATFCGHEGLSGAATGILGAVVTAVSTDPEFAERFRVEFVAPKLAVSKAIYQRAQERGEIAVITGFLPQQMSDAEMKAAVDAAIQETGAASMKDMGKVIGVLRGKYAGRMDFARASGQVKAALAG